MYTVILESLSSKSDLKAIVGAIANVLNVDKKGAVEKAKNLPLTLGENLPEKEAKLMMSMFGSLGAGVKALPPFTAGEVPERPIRDFKTEINRDLPLGCLLLIVLCMIGFAVFASLKYEWIIEQFKPSPEKSVKLLRKGDIGKAKRSIQTQLRAKPDDSNLWVLLGQAYIVAARKKMDAQQWKTYGEAGAMQELDSAIALFRKAESMNHKDGSIPRWISITEQIRQNMAEAETAARRAISIDPSDPDNWNQLGSVLVDLEKMSQAEQIFYNVVKARPNNFNALKNLVILNLYHTKDAERAAKFLFAMLSQKEAATDMDSHQLRTDLTSAMIGDFNPPWERLSPPKMPFEEYEKRRVKIVETPRSNDDPLAQEQLGLLFMSQGDYPTAEAYFIRAVNLGENEPSRKMLAVIYMMQENYEGALMIMQGAAKNKAKDPFFWKNIGVLQKYYKTNKPEALKAFNRYFALGGDSYGTRIKKEMKYE